jgi:hypothetical protein
MARIRLTLVRLRTKGTLFRTKLTPFPSSSVAETLARMSDPEFDAWEMGMALVVDMVRRERERRERRKRLVGRGDMMVSVVGT